MKSVPGILPWKNTANGARICNSVVAFSILAVVFKIFDENEQGMGIDDGR